MSKADTKAAMEDTFASKLGIEMVTPRIFEELIELNAGTRNVMCAIGPSGIGKTAIPTQVARSRNKGKGVPYVALHMPTMTQEGFFIPTTAADTKQYFDQRVPRLFQPIIEWAEQMDKKFKGKVPQDMCPILAIEELNRAVDKSVTRAAFVLIGDRMIGDIKLHDCIQIVVTMNPSGGGMNVNEFERDPAMRRRLLPIGVAYNYGDFMKHATTAGFHEHVVGHLGAQPSHGYDEMAALAGKAFACPATWETVSRLCVQFEAAGISLSSSTGRAAIAGAVGTASATAFLDFVRDNTLVVTPNDVLTSYGPDTEARKRFKKYLPKEGEGRLDKVTELTMGLATHIFADLTKKPEAITKALSVFIGDLPEEILMSFIQKLTDEANRLGNDAKNFLQLLNQKLASEPNFTDGLSRLHKAKIAAQKEAQTASPA
jgi:hypothetical protein